MLSVQHPAKLKMELGPSENLVAIHAHTYWFLHGRGAHTHKHIHDP